MLSVEIRANGMIAAYITAYNQGILHSMEIEAQKINNRAYQYEVYVPGDGVKTGVVYHDKDDGCAILVQRILQSANGPIDTKPKEL